MFKEPQWRYCRQEQQNPKIKVVITTPKIELLEGRPKDR
jgi:hypothetical protein